MADTKIEWTDKVWNPATGCSKVSPGCDNCYAERMAKRLRGRAGYPATDPFAVRFHPERLGEPHRWRKPSKVFVCSMSDLFHPRLGWEQITGVFRVMERCPQHTFQVLTKRPGRMAHFAQHVWKRPWPENVWAGTSVESQKYAPRLDVLARVPAKVRFVSAEPLLGPLDLRVYLASGYCANCGDGSPFGRCCDEPMRIDEPLINWVIAGGESGPNARPMHPAWVRSIRDQCEDAGVPFFFKQWGEFCPAGRVGGTVFKVAHHNHAPAFMQKVGKHAAGAVLDGREWREFPV